MFDKIFGWGKKKEGEQDDPGIYFGRYSDNNKPVAKVNRWTDADNLFKEKKYVELSKKLFAFYICIIVKFNINSLLFFTRLNQVEKIKRIQSHPFLIIAHHQTA